jgi:hypothetical protein
MIESYNYTANGRKLEAWYTFCYRAWYLNRNCYFVIWSLLSPRAGQRPSKSYSINRPCRSNPSYFNQSIDNVDSSPAIFNQSFKNVGSSPVIFYRSFDNVVSSPVIFIHPTMSVPGLGLALLYSIIYSVVVSQRETGRTRGEHYESQWNPPPSLGSPPPSTGL